MKPSRRDFVKCRNMIRAMQANQGYKVVQDSLANAVSMQKGKSTIHIVRNGPFAGVSFLQKEPQNA